MRFELRMVLGLANNESALIAIYGETPFVSLDDL